MQLRSEVAYPCVAKVSLVELSVVGDTVGTTQLHNQRIGIGQDVTEVDGALMLELNLG